MRHDDDIQLQSEPSHECTRIMRLWMIEIRLFSWIFSHLPDRLIARIASLGVFNLLQ